jgi:hypothetical protein
LCVQRSVTVTRRQCLYLTSVLALRSKEFNSIAIWSCHQCDPMGITPDLVAVKKHGGEKSGIEHICHGAGWSGCTGCWGARRPLAARGTAKLQNPAGWAWLGDLVCRHLSGSCTRGVSGAKKDCPVWGTGCWSDPCQHTQADAAMQSQRTHRSG